MHNKNITNFRFGRFCQMYQKVNFLTFREVADLGHSRKKLDLTGQKFGKLTVLAPAENFNGRTAWLCQCDCGRKTVAKTYHLRSGHTKSCGCQHGPGGPRYALGLTYIDGTCVEMLSSGTIRSNNTSGVPGVDWLKKKQRWRASICFKGKRHYLGCYASFEDAAKARRRAEEELFEPFLREFAAETDKQASGN